MLLFVDRFKCFDLLIPSFCISLARDLGLPGHLATCIKGFFSGQYKCFKLGPFFGPRVVQSNGIIQGCPFSVLFAHLIFSVFAKRIQNTAQISFASFLDDTKLWSKVSDFPALVNAASQLSNFDAAVGQIQNDAKSAILCRKKKETQRFLIQVGRRLTKKTSAKSLGFFHTSHRRGGGKLQDARLEKAKATVLKVSKLPLSGWQKGFYIKLNAHSQWLHGSEIQAPSKTAFGKLRTGVVNAVFPRKNNMRSPFLATSTHSDVWIDPWAAWVNGAPVVLARLLKDLGWTWADDPCVWSRRSDANFYLHSGSQTFFQEELERSVRQRLVAQSPIRHDNLGDAKDRHINIELTRFFADGDFASSDVSDVLAQHISQIPTSIQHAKLILPFMLTGSLFDGPRKQRSGLV